MALSLMVGFYASSPFVAASAAPRVAETMRATTSARPIVVETTKPVSVACTETLAYEKAAAADGTPPQASLDAATAGLGTNERCVDPVMHPVNEAFLLSLRAMAKLALHIDDWKTDFDRANALLARCEARHDKAGAPAGSVCKTQQDFNRRFIAEYAPATPAPGQPLEGTLPAPLVAPVNPPGMATPAASPSPPTIGPVPPASSGAPRSLVAAARVAR